MKLVTLNFFFLIKVFFLFHRFEYQKSVQHDEKNAQPKFGGNQFMGAWDMVA